MILVITDVQYKKNEIESQLFSDVEIAQIVDGIFMETGVPRNMIYPITSVDPDHTCLRNILVLMSLERILSCMPDQDQ